MPKERVSLREELLPSQGDRSALRKAKAMWKKSNPSTVNSENSYLSASFGKGRHRVGWSGPQLGTGQGWVCSTYAQTVIFVADTAAARGVSVPVNQSPRTLPTGITRSHFS